MQERKFASTIIIKLEIIIIAMIIIVSSTSETLI